MIMVQRNTPVEEYTCLDIPVFVKREDTAAQSPGPSFSKVRGLYVHLKKLKEKGVTTVGYTETSISMAGWGVAWACEGLGLKAVLYDPQYKETPSVLKYHRKQWERFSPDIIPIKAGRAVVNYYISCKHLRETYGENSVMLNLGLPLEETITETAKEWKRTMKKVPQPLGTTVVNIGSGTICAGILRGWEPGNGKIIGVLGRHSNLKMKYKNIAKKTKRTLNGMIGVPFQLIDEGWEYTEKCDVKTPFPCHPYYDKKAWVWLENNIEELEQPILFWNIGRM